MADVTGGPVVTNASPFAVPADLTDLKNHFGDASNFGVPTIASLPASGNWYGRILSVQEDESVRRWHGSGWDIIWLPADSGWQALTLSGGWVSFGSGYGDPRYRLINGVVHMAGLIKSGTVTAGTVIATLPLGYRPSSQEIYVVANNGVGQTVQVATNGQISLGAGIGNTSLSLTGVRFPIG